MTMATTFLSPLIMRSDTVCVYCRHVCVRVCASVCVHAYHAGIHGNDISVSSDHEVRHCVRLLSRSLVRARELMVEEGSRAACNMVYIIF